MSKFNILAADKIAQEGLDYVKAQADANLISKPGIKEAELATLVPDADALIVRSGVKVTKEVLANPGRLKVIARAGVGVDNIDLEAATEKGILVVNTAAASTITTAEHAFTLMMALLRKVGPAYLAMNKGGWDRNKFEGRQLHGLTLGVVGFGRIGQTVAERALAFGMKVVAFDPVFNAETAMDGRVKMYKDFEAILPQCDVLTFHVPLTDATRGMLGAATFPKCKKGVYVVNASRGGIIDEKALVVALDAGQCAGAALDVFPVEPPPADDPLRTHPKVLVTPHLGASTEEAQTAVSVEAAIACLKFLRGEGIEGAVNAGNFRVDLSPAQRAYVDLAGRAATLIAPMVTRGIASINVEVRGQSLAKAAGTIERAAVVGLLKGLMNAPVNVINVISVAKARGIAVRTTIVEDTSESGTGITLEVKGPEGSVDGKTVAPDRSRKIVGRVYDDLKPRITEINGYRMDMVPAGHMVLLQNSDKPGMIGLVGTALGMAGVNIADLTLSRRDGERDSGGQATALMTLKVDSAPAKGLLESLANSPGVLKVAAVELPSL